MSIISKIKLYFKSRKKCSNRSTRRALQKKCKMSPKLALSLKAASLDYLITARNLIDNEIKKRKKASK